MWTYCVMVLMTMFSVFFMPVNNGFNNDHTTIEKNMMLANEFIFYRDGAMKYAYNNPLTTGIVQSTSISLPPTITTSGSWIIRIDTNRKVYVHGIAKAGLLRQITHKMGNTYSVGVKTNGRMSNPSGSIVTLPSWIPNNSIVSVVQM